MRKILSLMGLIAPPLTIALLSVGTPQILLVILALAANSIPLLLLAFFLPAFFAAALMSTVL